MKKVHTNVDSQARGARLDRHKSWVAALFLMVLPFISAVHAADSIIGYTGPDPSNTVQTTFQGCRLENDDGTYSPVESLICSSQAYTTGNLGKKWEELDLVPHRITMKKGGGTEETYQIIVGADHLVNPNTTPPAIGYDRLALFKYNAGESTGPACTITQIGDNQIGDFGIGGSDTQIVQVLEITQQPNSTCVFDHVQLLAIGAAQISGSSNQSFVVSGGSKTVPIPSDVQPQDLDKTLAATLDSEVMWSIEKSADPISLNFGNTCDASTPLQKDTVISIAFTKDRVNPLALNATSTILATNPSSRDVRYTITDTLYGQSPCGSSESVLDEQTVVETVQPGSENIIVQHILPADSCNLRNHAHAKVEVEDILAPGNYITVGMLEAEYVLSDNAITEGVVSNQMVRVSDKEKIFGNDLDFAASQTGGVSGDFQDGYIAGVFTTDPVLWLSDQQNDSGTVQFTKTVRVEPFVNTTGTLKDKAKVLTADGITALAYTPLVSVALSAEPLVELTVTKTIPAQFLGGVTEATFEVTGPNGYNNTVVISLNGELSKSETLTNLTPGSYTVVETDTTFDGVPGVLVAAIGSQTVEIDLPSCEDSVTFQNVSVVEPEANVEVKKITAPVLDTGDLDFDWEFTLNCTGFTPEIITAGANEEPVPFDTVLNQSTVCTVTETPIDGWDLVWVNSDETATECSFSVNLPVMDAGKTFSCAFKNVKRGDVEVFKTESGVPTSGYNFEIRKDASAGNDGDTLAKGTSDDTGVVNFLCEAGFEAYCVNVSGTAKLVPGDYQLCETGLMPGWDNNLSDIGSTFYPDPLDNSTECVNFSLAAGESKVFQVDNTPPPGGDARTIGFWRNWSSCTGGNQADVLGETLTAAGGSILIGNLSVDNCYDAVNILSKRDLDGNNKANDAAYDLAAQLLAARLNVQAQAGTCEAANTAMAQGQALLDGIDFIGTGDYLGPQVRGALRTKRNQALELADILDRYNNNTLCP